MTSISKGQTAQVQPQQMSSPSSPADNHMSHVDSQIARDRVGDEGPPNSFSPHMVAEHADHYPLASGEDTGRSRVYSNHIDQLIRDISLEFHDSEHLASNRTQARNLWRASGLEVEDFVELLYIVRGITRERGNIEKLAATGTGSKLPSTRNKMPYYFAVLRNELHSLLSAAQALKGGMQ